MHPYKETTIHKLYTGCEARLNFAYCTFKMHAVQKWAHTHCSAANLGSYSVNIQTLMVMCVWHSFMKCHYLLLGLCGVLWAVCGVLWAVGCVLWAVSFSFYSFFHSPFFIPPNINTFWHHLLHTCSITTACISFFSKTEASAHTANSSEHFQYIHYLLHTKFLI